MAAALAPTSLKLLRVGIGRANHSPMERAGVGQDTTSLSRLEV
ncbi:MAG: hypothetical protein N2508_02270 [Anaerolineae bacterium]|nr:hypothetical protein [Anaerolineae bacterium]